MFRPNRGRRLRAGVASRGFALLPLVILAFSSSSLADEAPGAKSPEPVPVADSGPEADPRYALLARAGGGVGITGGLAGAYRLSFGGDARFGSAFLVGIRMAMPLIAARSGDDSVLRMASYFPVLGLKTPGFPLALRLAPGVAMGSWGRMHGTSDEKDRGPSASPALLVGLETSLPLEKRFRLSLAAEGEYLARSSASPRILTWTLGVGLQIGFGA